MQGAVLGSDAEVLGHTLAQVCNCAAMGSLVLGTLGGLPRNECENVLASNGLLGTVADAESEARQQGKLRDHEAVAAERTSECDPLWLFTSQHQRLSLAEMDTYNAHTRAAEETDEDFFGNFS
jgi:hypothetical protein